MKAVSGFDQYPGNRSASPTSRSWRTSTAGGSATPDRPRALRVLGHRHQDGGRGRRHFRARRRVGVHRLGLDQPRAATPGSSRHPRPRPAHGWRRRTRGRRHLPVGPRQRERDEHLTLSEELKAGYAFVDTNAMSPGSPRGGRVRRRRRDVTTPVGEVTIGPNQYARCTVRNRIRPGTIEIEKNATPESSQAFAFTGSPASATSRWWMTGRTNPYRGSSPPSHPGSTRSARWFRRIGSSRASRAPPQRPQRSRGRR